MEGRGSAKEKDGVTSDCQTDSGGKEERFVPGGGAEIHGAQAEPTDANRAQAPKGNGKDRYSLLNKRRSHRFIQTIMLGLHFLSWHGRSVKRNGRIWENYGEIREYEGTAS
jgi:hypothetical protein